MVSDIRVIIVKLADRLHNMRTLGVAAARAAGAHRPGDARDLRAHRPPPGHGQDPRRTGGPGVSATWSRRRTPRSAARDRDRSGTRTRTSSSEIRHDVEVEAARAKASRRASRAASSAPTRSTRRLKRQKIGLDQVYDLLALRIITDSVKNCYAALGVIHNEWHPIPGPHQGLHRHSAAQPVPVAAHLRDRARRHSLRGADPHRGDAPHRRGRHRRALEVQGGQARARRRTTSASPGCGSWSSGSRRCATPASSCPR